MANANKPQGLSPHSYLNGSIWNGQATVYAIPTTDTSNAYSIGDPVTLGGSADANGIPTVVLCGAGDTAGNEGTRRPLGAIVGLAPSGNVYGGAVGAGGNQFAGVVIPAGTRTATVYVLVADDPNLLYEMQEGGVGTALAAADLGININLLSGTNNSYISGWLLDNNSKATTSTYQMQLMRLVQKADNALGANAKWLVRINAHPFKAGTTGF